ncbi:MAG: CDP-archaeol synthase [Gammaproteobacteria bacterium]|nr:CDP-archaeol synthase [Gammaproteobacteria bacterium]
MIWQVFAVTLPGFAVGAVFMAMASRRVSAETLRSRWLKLIVFFLIVHVVLGVAALGRPWVTVLVAVVLVAGAIELRSAWQRMPVPRSKKVWPIFVAAVAVALAVSWALPPLVFAFLFLVTAACDGFSQVVGQLVGRHKLAPQISPGKTIEGLLGGLFAAVVVALLVRGLLLEDTSAHTAALALLVGLAGLAGDLAASWVKRRAGIKDYSAALPGQGGFLDRFDSLLGAMTIVGPALAIAGA